MSLAEPHVLTALANSNLEALPLSHPLQATVLRVSEGLRIVFGSPGYKAPMLPRVALEIHDLSCQLNVDGDKLVHVLERDPLLAAHVLRVANSPIFRGRDAETSLKQCHLSPRAQESGRGRLRTCLTHARVSLRRVFGMMEQLRRHSTACANLCRLLASHAGQDPEHAFLCGLLHDIGIAAILIVLGERGKSEPTLEPSVLDGVVRQIHEDVSGMLVRLWKLPDEVAEVVAHHHGRAAVETAPVLSAVVAIADTLATKFNFTVDLGVGSCDGNDPEVFAAACAKVNLDLSALAAVEKEAREVLAHVDEALKHKSADVAEAAPSHPSDENPSKAQASLALPPPGSKGRGSFIGSQTEATPVHADAAGSSANL
jgi:putative nucleotidyltransferase with HDIG domain